MPLIQPPVRSQGSPMGVGGTKAPAALAKGSLAAAGAKGSELAGPNWLPPPKPPEAEGVKGSPPAQTV